MNQTLKVAKVASSEIEEYLRGVDGVYDVINVEDVEEFRIQDVDLLVFINQNNKNYCKKVEIKGDTMYNTGNYFFETISNKSRGTLGCFLYTEADYIYYYYVKEKELHVLPTKRVREWFLANQNRFPKRSASTPVGSDYYVTEGRIVPRNIVKKEVSGVNIIKINDKKCLTIIK